MTCNHVLGLIDAGPFADYPPAHLNAAWEHARHCPTCGPALKAATALTADLAALPEPSPPPDLTATVLARIARIDDLDPASVTARASEPQASSRRRDWSLWPRLGALAAGLAMVLASGEAPVNIMPFSMSGMSPGLAGMPRTTVEAVMLAAGIALYVAGLFVPLARKQRSASG
jgi:hypothetical protein